MHKSVFQTDDDGLFLYETVANDLPLSPGACQRALWRLSRCAARRHGGRWPRWTAMAGRWSKTIAPRRYGGRNG